MLTVTEDMLLLTLQRDRGRIPAHSKVTLRHALTGSALLDLELTGRIDTDLEHLEAVDTTPTGKPFLDPVLEEIANSDKTRDIWGWLQTLAPEQGDEIRERTLASLVERDILQHQPRGLFGPRYQRTGEAGETDARERIASTLFSEEDEIPDPQDIALICIADACDLLHTLFRKKQLKRTATRLQQLRKMDLVGGGTVAQLALWNLEHSAL
ncbi:MAG: GPP34 family phosphoprotein [Gammaproteobacteria bacterium]|nr:GPP34 family phosphoprotein [Gammaproteobacteria bacterium]